MPKPQVLMTAPYPSWDMEPMESLYDLHRLWDAPDKAALLAAAGPAIQAIATNGERGADRALIERLPRLEIIACYGVGTDAIDLAAAQARGVRVTNTPGVLTNDVADMAMALVLAVLRRIVRGDAFVRAGHWMERRMDLATSLTGKTLGILGLGRIGQAVARRAAAFEMRVAYASRTRRETPYVFAPDAAALAAMSDVLVVTLPGGRETRHVVDARVLDALGPDGFLINVSRGSTVDEDALVEALRGRRIAGAGLDVFASEPAVDKRLLAFDTVVVQPHNSSGTIETRKAMGQLVRDNLSAHFAGRELLTPVV